MFKLALRGVRYNSGRYIATLIAIITGVAFFTATGFLSDRVIDALEGDVNRQYGGVDAAVVVDDEAAGVSSPTTSASRGDVADEIAALPEVEAVGGELSGRSRSSVTTAARSRTDATGRLWIDDDELNPSTSSRARRRQPPARSPSTVGLADDEDLDGRRPGHDPHLAGQFDATIVGITTFGNCRRPRLATAPCRSRRRLPSTGSTPGQVEYEDLYLRGNVNQADTGRRGRAASCRRASRSRPGDEFLRGQAGRGQRIRQGPQDRPAGLRRCWRCSSAPS